MVSLTDNKAVNFLRDAKNELKKVVWPSRKELIKDTLIVIGVSLSVAFFLGILDFVFSLGMEEVIDRF